MKKRTKAVALCLALMLTTLPLSGCAPSRAADLMDGVTPNPVSVPGNLDTEDTAAVADFAVRLFQGSLGEDENTLVSPLSALCALAMTANGAKGETLSQMEAVFGMPVGELNRYLYAYVRSLPSGDKYKLSVANSIWFRDDESLTVERGFLQANADWYGAGVYRAPFDHATADEINRWVSGHTGGMIENILDRIPEDAVMYLVNALAFDAEWQTVYNEHQVRDGAFTAGDGSIRDVKLMYSSESGYLEDEGASGFIKYYADGKYAFAALLPREGACVQEYAASLTGERLMQMLSHPQEVRVNAAIPKFESEYTVEMSGTLQAMGMADAFDFGKSDFSGIGSSSDGNLGISRVLHKTRIAVDEKGTKAGAATVVEVTAGSALIEPDEVKTVYLDRPFLYMLIDCETGLPIFIGAMMDTED